MNMRLYRHTPTEHAAQAIPFVHAVEIEFPTRTPSA